MQGLVLEDESWFGARAAVFKKGKQLCSLAAPPPRLLLEDFSASFGKQQINSVPNNLSFVDDLLPSKQDLDRRTKPLFSGGGIMVQLVWGWEGQTQEH